MRTLTIRDLPLPPAVSSPNRRAAWQKKASAAKQYRNACAFLALDAVRRAGWEAPATVRLDLVLGTAPRLHEASGRKLPDGRYRPLDEDNAVAACKALFDGLRDAGAVAEDHSGALRIGGVRIDSEAAPGVTVTITEVER